MRTRLNFIFLTLLCVFILTACSSNKLVKTYAGDVLPNEAISILTAPENITLLSVNEKPVAQYMLSNLDVNYALKEGNNVIVFKYESIWSKAKRDEELGARVEVVESEPLAVVIPAFAGKHYTFNFVPAGNVREANEIAANFVAQIVDEKKNLVADSISLNEYQKNIEQKENQEVALLVEKEVFVTPVSQENAHAEASVLERLKAIWPSASADEKKAFLVWVFQK